MSHSSNKLAYVAILFYVFIATTIAYFVNGKSLVGIDDANIYMVYMRNLASGHGFVYDVGGEHVEGFTSFLWTLIGALFFCVSSRPEILLLIFNLLVVSYSLWRVCLFINVYVRSETFFSLHTCLFLGIMLALPGYFEWSVLSLMETGLWSVLLILLTLNIITYDNSSSIKRFDLHFAFLLVLLIICRPESILWGIFFLLLKICQLGIRYRSLKIAFVQIAPLFILFVFCIAGLIFWRILYFGYPFPNTYYAKVSGDKMANLKTGFVYVYSYFRDTPFLILLFLIFATFLYKEFRKAIFGFNVATFSSTFVLFAIILISLFSFIFPLYSGGDHFGYFRLLQPTVPVMVLSLILVLVFFNLHLNNSWVFVIAIFALLSSANNVVYSLVMGSTPIREGWELAREKRLESQKLNDLFAGLAQYPSQGVSAAGGSAFSYKGRTIDLLGLNNAAMAHADKIKDTNVPKNHASFNKNVFYQLHPDIFWLEGGFVENSDSIPINITAYRAGIFKNINEDTRFKNFYTGCLIVRKSNQMALKIFASNKFLDALDTNYFKIIRYN